MSTLQVMIRTIIFGIFFLLLLAPSVSAAETKVNVSNNADDSTSNVSVKSMSTGSSTTCINGKCTTTEGENKGTVCVNGECYTSEDGNIDVKSEDGNTTVTVNNSKVSSDSSEPEVVKKPDNKKFFYKKITKEEAKEKMKEKLREKEHNWVEFVGSHTLNMIKKLFLFSIF